MIDSELFERIAQLSPKDRIEFINALWDTLPHDALPVTDAEKALLDSRLAETEKSPEDESDWPDVKARLQKQLP